MKHLDQQSIEIAAAIAEVLPNTNDRLTNASILTALTVLLFYIGKKIELSPDMLPLAITILSETADTAIAELNNEGVNV